MTPSEEEINKDLAELAKIRIQRRIGNLTPNERLDIFFSQPMLLNGVALSSHFIKLLRINFSVEEINQVFTSKEENSNNENLFYTSASKSQKFDDFTYSFTKGKVNSFATYVNLAAERYFNNEVNNIIDFLHTYADKLPQSELLNKIIEEFQNPLPTK